MILTTCAACAAPLAHNAPRCVRCWTRYCGAPTHNIVAVQSNLATTYRALGRYEEALHLRREIYSLCLKQFGEHEHTLSAANNYAVSLIDLSRFEEVKSLMRKTMPVARRVLGENDETMLKMRWTYADALYDDAGATLDDLHEAVTTLEDTERITRRVLGSAHPLFGMIERDLQKARAVLRARETPPGK
jgi:hypothetical protein